MNKNIEQWDRYLWQRRQRRRRQGGLAADPFAAGEGIGARGTAPSLPWAELARSIG